MVAIDTRIKYGDHLTAAGEASSKRIGSANQRNALGKSGWNRHVLEDFCGFHHGEDIAQALRRELDSQKRQMLEAPHGFLIDSRDPLEKTTERSRSIALLYGLFESQALVNPPPPRLMLAAAMLNEERRSKTRSNPAMMSEVNARTQGGPLGQLEAVLKRENT